MSKGGKRKGAGRPKGESETTCELVTLIEDIEKLQGCDLTTALALISEDKSVSKWIRLAAMKRLESCIFAKLVVSFWEEDKSQLRRFHHAESREDVIA